MNVLSPVPLFADCVASLDIRRLYRLGLFKHSPNQVRVECSVVSSETPQLQVEVSWDADDGRVRLNLADRWQDQVQTVKVGRREKPRGGGYYFECPVGGEICEKLYYAEGGWGGRKAKGLKYSTQFGSQHDRFSHTISRLTGLLEGSEDRAPLTPQRRAQLELRLTALKARLSPTRRGRGRPRKQREEPNRFADLEPVAAPNEASPSLAWLLACERALERAEAMGGDVDDSLGWLFRRSDDLREAVGRTPPQTEAEILRLTPDYLESHPRISLQALAPKALVRPGARRGVRLDWAGLGCEVDACTMMVDLRDETSPFVGLEIAAGGQTIDQALKLVRSAHGGMRFVCPLSGLEVDTIVYRAGCFASASALRLTRRRGRA